MTDENKHPEVKNIHDELKEMEKEKNIIEENIQNLENLHINLKNKLINQEKKIDEQEHKIKLEQIKLKNQHQIDILLEKNKKLEKYLEIISKKYELEIKHIEQYCDHKSRIYKISEKYSYINFNEINELESSMNNESNQNFTNFKNEQKINSSKKEIEKNNDIYISPQNKNVKSDIPPPPPPPEPEKKVESSNISISSNIKSNKNDIRNNPSFQDQLKNAFNNKYKALRPLSDDEDDDSFN